MTIGGVQVHQLGLRSSSQVTKLWNLPADLLAKVCYQLALAGESCDGNLLCLVGLLHLNGLTCRVPTPHTLDGLPRTGDLVIVSEAVVSEAEESSIPWHDQCNQMMGISSCHPLDLHGQHTASPFPVSHEWRCCHGIDLSRSSVGSPVLRPAAGTTWTQASRDCAG